MLIPFGTQLNSVNYGCFVMKINEYTALTWYCVFSLVLSVEKLCAYYKCIDPERLQYKLKS